MCENSQTCRPSYVLDTWAKRKAEQSTPSEKYCEGLLGMSFGTPCPTTRRPMTISRGTLETLNLEWALFSTSCFDMAVLSSGHKVSGAFHGCNP